MPFNPSVVRAVLFDMDGTLADTDDNAVRTVARLLPGRSRSAARRIVMAANSPVGLAFTWLDRLGVDAPVMRALDSVSRSRWSHTDRPGLVIPGVAEAVQELASRYALGVVSSRWESAVEGFLARNGLRRHFRCVVTALTCPHTKPFAEPILYAAAALGVAPRNCVMVGDAIVDMRSARSAGAQAIGVLCGFGTEAELRRSGADLVLASTADVPAALRSGPRAAA